MKIMHSNKKLVVVGALSVVTLLAGAKTTLADDVMHRLYNPNSGEHFYTASFGEKDHLSNIGWKYEGVGWLAPNGSNKGDAVYRLYNRFSGDHHYTASSAERDSLVKIGWTYEGIGWYSAKPNEGKPMYRLYNPYAKVGSHHYTLSASERDWLVPQGWKAEGIAWYGVDQNKVYPKSSPDGSFIPDGISALGNSGRFFDTFNKANDWAVKQAADSSSQWYGMKITFKAVYKGDYQIGFSPEFQSYDNSPTSPSQPVNPQPNQPEPNNPSNEGIHWEGNNLVIPDDAWTYVDSPYGGTTGTVGVIDGSRP